MQIYIPYNVGEQVIDLLTGKTVTILGVTYDVILEDGEQKERIVYWIDNEDGRLLHEISSIPATIEDMLMFY